MSKNKKKQAEAPKGSKLQRKLEQRVYKTVKNKVLKKELKKRLAKGQLLPIKALVPLGTIIAAGCTIVPVTAAVAGYQIHKAVKKHWQAAPKPVKQEAPSQSVQAGQVPADPQVQGKSKEEE